MANIQILLVGGPCDGRTAEVDENLPVFHARKKRRSKAETATYESYRIRDFAVEETSFFLGIHDSITEETAIQRIFNNYIKG